MMYIKEIILKYKVSDKFNLIDYFFSKILLGSVSIFFLFNVFNFMSLDNFNEESFYSLYPSEFISNFKIGVFSNDEINFNFINDLPKISSSQKYKEVIYYNKNKDLGILTNKSIDLIKMSIPNVNNNYIEVSVMKYGTQEELFKVLWNRNEENTYNLYI